MTATRTILHADLDAFYAAVEQRDDPPLRGRPVIVGGLGRRGVVATASYEARRFGVHSALPTAEARRRCPDGVFLPPRMEVYAAVAEQVRAVFARYTPDIEPLSLDEAFLDVTASRALFGDGPAIAAAIRADVRTETGLGISVGVAACKYVAKVASDLRKPDALVVVPAGEEASFLAPLPVARLWGAGPTTQERLRRHGLRTIGDVQRAGRARLVAWLGESTGAHFAAIAHGVDPRPVVADHDPKSISHEVTFDVDVADDDRVHAVLLRLSEAVGRRLRRHGFRARVVKVKVRFPPFETRTRQARVDGATDDDLELCRVAARLVGAVRPPGRPVRLLGVGAAELCAAGARQGTLFAAPGDARHGRLLRAVDAIRERFGDGAVFRGSAEDG